MKTKLLVGALLLASGPAHAKPYVPPPEPPTKPDWVMVRDQGLSKLTSTLFDPSSAVINWTSGFQWGYFKPFIGRRTHAWVACGTINAKNRLGGYVGSTPFFVAADANGSVTAFMGYEYLSTCTDPQGTKVPVNPELNNISPTMPLAGGSATSVADELEKLAALRDKGIITQAEFDAQKARLLAR